jgi:antitoxin (DNA-binding transcriptional repressor) of toxin-antitoxin stability system
MEYVSKGLMKAKMLEYFRKVQQTGDAIIVTDNRIPVVKIIPIRKKMTPKEIFGKLQGKVKYFEPLNRPTSDEWGDI